MITRWLPGLSYCEVVFCSLAYSFHGGSQQHPLPFFQLPHPANQLSVRYTSNINFSLDHQLFEEISQPDLSHFNKKVHHLSHRNSFSEVLQVYISIFTYGLHPNGSSLPCILKACTGLPALSFGRTVHAHVICLGFEAATFIQNGLIVMYARFGEIATAYAVFDQLTHPNVVSWTSIISGYSQNGIPLEALRIFQKMRWDSVVVPDFITLVSVLKAYIDVEDLEQGRCVHGLVVKFGHEDELDLIITLTAMYAKCGHVHSARYMFDQVSFPEVILWNTMISGYAKNGQANEAVELFKEMVARNVRPDSITLRSAILACAKVGSLRAASWICDFVSTSEFRNDIFVKTAIIDMYVKCGSIVLARAVFDSIPHKDVVVWSTMIMGYGLHGHGREAIYLFHEMIRSKICPNDVTFVGLLSACKHSGLIEEGRKYFHLMIHKAIEPRHQHYACLVDLHARAGHLEEAYEFIRGMPMAPQVTVWGALLNACNIYGHVKLGNYAAERVFAIEPWNAGHYVQLSNMYASAGMWKDVAKIRILMKERGVTKDTGFSSIEINGQIQSFYAGDKSHPSSKEIFVLLDELERKFKYSGFLQHNDEELSFVQSQ